MYTPSYQRVVGTNDILILFNTAKRRADAVFVITAFTVMNHMAAFKIV